MNWLIWAAAAAAGAPPTPATPSGRVLLVSLCDDFPAVEQIMRRSAEQLTRSGWNVERLPAASPPWRRACPQQAEDVLHLVARGKQKFHNLKIPAARKELRLAVADLARALAAGALKPMQEAVLHLAWADLELGHRGRANRYFSDGARLWPDWRPSALDYPPLITEAVENAAAAALTSATGTVRLDSPNSGLHLILDGQHAATGPTTFDELVPGMHYLSVTHPKAGTFFRSVEVAAETTSPVFFDLREDPRVKALLLSGDGPVPPDAAAAPQADWIVVIRDQGKTMALQVKGPKTTTQPLQPDNIKASVSNILALVGTPAVLAPPEAAPGPIPPEPDAATSAPFSWWWPAAGVLGAAIIGGTITWLVWRSNDDLRTTIRPGPM